MRWLLLSVAGLLLVSCAKPRKESPPPPGPGPRPVECTDEMTGAARDFAARLPYRENAPWMALGALVQSREIPEECLGWVSGRL